MSTEAITEPESGRDDGYEQNLRPEAGEMGTETEETVAPPVGWLPDADAETTKYLASRGWDKDPQGLLRSQREAEKALRAEQEARASMEEELAEYRDALLTNGQQQNGYGQQPDNDPFGIVAAATAYENGEINMAQFAQYQQAATLQAAQQIAQEIVGQQVAPLQTFQQTDVLQRTAAQMADQYPDFASLSDDVLSLIEQHPHLYGTADGMKAAYGLVRSERDASTARERRSAQAAETLDGGSRGNSAPDAAEAVRKQLRELGGPRDGF